MPSFSTSRCTIAGSLLLPLVLVTVLVTVARAQDPVDLGAFMAEMEQAAAEVTHVFAHGTRTILATDEGRAAGPEVSVEVLMAFEAPRRFRMLVESPLGGKTLMISDGKAVYTYLPDRGEFTRQSLEPEDEAATQDQVAPDVTAQTRQVIVGQLMPRGLDARFVREAMLQVGGEDVWCVVIEFEPPTNRGHEKFTITQWIEKERHVVRREERRGRQTVPGGTLDVLVTTQFETVTLNEPLEPSLFVFKPPTTAEEVASLRRPDQGMTKSPWIGKEGPDFTLSDLNGVTWSLSSLRGRVVLLDFWATWCGPCKIELPHIQALHEEFKNDGLVVLGISNETKGKVHRYVTSAGYTFPTLVDTGAEVTRQYQVSSIPTVMILDREGHVAEHLIGAQSEDTLRRALATAGIE